MFSFFKITSVVATAFALIAVTQAGSAPDGQILPVIKGDAFCKSFVASCKSVCAGLGQTRNQKYTCYTIPKTGKHGASIPDY